MLVQVFPASSNLYTPSPCEMLQRMQASPVPTYKMFGSDAATATLPIDDTACLSKIGVHVIPPFVVFHTPPAAAPK